MSDSLFVNPDAKGWAESMFGQCELGDSRRTRRAVDVAARQAAKPDGSIHQICDGDDAAAEGAYRLLRNSAVKPTALEEAPFQRNAALCTQVPVVLAIQDTTTLVYKHAVSEQLGDLGGGRGFIVHSTLAVNAQTQEVIGLLDQQRWSRPASKKKRRRKKKKQTKKQLPYEQRESYKWERASQRIEQRLDSMERVIQVGDREADIYEYIKERIEKSQRYVIRANYDRRLATTDGHLWDLMRERPVLGHYEVTIGQRGAQPAELGRTARASRPARIAKMELRTACKVRLLSPGPRRKKGQANSWIEVNVVYARETGAADPDKALEWMLLTSEPVTSQKQARTVIGYYEQRWLIEEFHKAWKTGCTIEQRRLQAPSNLERLAVITAHVAVRLLQLRCLAYSEPERPCDAILSQEEWHCLHSTTQKGRPLPKAPPSLRWAIQAIAKLGGWRDTKRTGRIGWISLWRGWVRFQERFIGWQYARQHL